SSAPETGARVVSDNPEAGYFTGRNARETGGGSVTGAGDSAASKAAVAGANAAGGNGNASKPAKALEPTAVGTQGSLPLEPKQGHEGPEVFTEAVRMNDLIKQYMNIYTSPSGIDWLKLVLQRAAPFRDYIASRIQHYHMPPELLYLPIVESTYSPYAVSGSGAAGLWQFMTNSIYPYGLQINEWMDERFDFWRSTDASLEKLKYNYDQLGDWLLALAAYNVGLNYVQQVVRRTGIHDVWELGAKGYLPYETMVYIPKFLAIAAVCSYPGRYGLPVDWETSVHWARIKLDQAVDLRILAREAGIDESLLLEGNAELRYYITPPGDSNYYLKVPQRDSKVVEQVLKRQKFHLMRFYIYTVQSGDTLYDLSLYYGVPVSMILQYNPRASARYLQIGERLVIPGLKDVAPYSRAAAARLQPQGPTITLHDPSGRFTGLYTVRPGDSLWAISKRFGITPGELAKVNGITESTIIRDGIVLHVPGPGALIIEGAN
ncbi:MAG TPA: LysM peptidoglycan-binding domain-containing protein, partial [Spirochaetia bacterium]|nr:LysM peptidoglycan-binding domain-containing protein [Spirochaetia bacterium]